MKIKKNKINARVCTFVFTMIFLLSACDSSEKNEIPESAEIENEATESETIESETTGSSDKREDTIDNKQDVDVSVSGMTSPDYNAIDIPEYSGSAYAVINNNEPFFSDGDLSTVSYEYYSELDSLGRCGVTYACVGADIMPTEERDSIGQVKPTGWHTVKYDIVDGKYLYNRCHLIGYQLTGENANTQNLITGTRSMNVDGMLPFENIVADYVKETDNHVMYRVTPIFEGDNLLANGVLMEAKSVEDNGEGILFNVFVYNVQDGIVIDYVTGDSYIKEEPTTTIAPTATPTPTTTAVEKNIIIANKNTKAYHRETCSHLPKEKNRVYFDSADEAEAAGYNNPCDYCNP